MIDVRLYRPNIVLLATIVYTGVVLCARQAGPYLIDDGCYGLSSGGPSYGNIIEQDIQNMRTNLRGKIRRDLTEGLSTSQAFKTFFTDPDDVFYVKQVFHRIEIGQRVRFGNAAGSPIELICVPKGGQTQRSAREECERRPGAAVLTLMDHPPRVWLCPRIFLDWVPGEPRHDSCPVLDESGKMQPSQSGYAGPEGVLPLHFNRQANFMIAFMDYYKRLEVDGEQRRSADIRNCAELPPAEQLKNSFNYAFYYSAVLAGCTDLYEPPALPPAAHDELRKILQASNEGETVGDAEVINKTVSSVASTDANGYWHIYKPSSNWQEIVP